MGIIKRSRRARPKEKSWLDFKDLGAQPDSKRHVYGKAEPFLTTGGGAVPENPAKKKKLLICYRETVRHTTKG